MRLTVTNKTSYPTKTVERLVRAEAEAAGLHRVNVTIDYARRGSGYASGWAENHGAKVLIRLPRRGVQLSGYVPYRRLRESGKAFPYADWKEALVAVAAHEFEHQRQWQVLGEYRHRRGSGKRRTDVELRCDLAAYRAWKAYRQKQGLETHFALAA